MSNSIKQKGLLKKLFGGGGGGLNCSYRDYTGLFLNDSCCGIDGDGGFALSL